MINIWSNKTYREIKEINSEAKDFRNKLNQKEMTNPRCKLITHY